MRNDVLYRGFSHRQHKTKQTTAAIMPNHLDGNKKEVNVLSPVSDEPHWETINLNFFFCL